MSKYNVAVDGVSVEAVFNKLGGIEGAQRFLRGDAEVVIKTHRIDLDANPFVPEGWEVVEHQQLGQFEWDAAKVALLLSESQKNGRVVEGNKLRLELKGQRVANACLLDYLLANPNLIPEEWKGKYVFFWGTIYRYSDGNLFVRYLYCCGKLWHWHYYWLGLGWHGHNPAALLASD